MVPMLGDLFGKRRERQYLMKAADVTGGPEQEGRESSGQHRHLR